MTVTSLRIANFKAFAASQHVPLRPITLIYGANSSGKSSILHALALAHHATETGALDTHRTQIGGDAIDLGGFRQYVHRRDDRRQVELGFTLDPTRLSGRAAQLLNGAQEAQIDITIGVGVTSNQLDLFGNRARELDGDGGARLERFELSVDGAPLLSMSARAAGRLLRLDRLDRSQPLFREMFRRLQDLETPIDPLSLEEFCAIEEDSDAFGEVLDAVVPSITAKSRGLIPRVDTHLDANTIGEGVGNLERRIRQFLPEALRDLVDNLGAAIENHLRRLRYLGPLRSYPSPSPSVFVAS